MPSRLNTRNKTKGAFNHVATYFLTYRYVSCRVWEKYMSYRTKSSADKGKTNPDFKEFYYGIQHSGLLGSLFLVLRLIF
jgi:hypothetical protein